jgi:8-oxo-dGTP diphosphatase
MMPDYDKVGLLAIRNNRILLCRKKYTTALLILPGGCYEPGESAEACLNRELREELGDVRIESAQCLGTYVDRAAGPAGKIVRIELYRADLIGDPSPQAEICELVWFGAEDDRTQLAPSIANKILPDLISRGVLGWR